jgi:antirestriction protein ArdC
MRLSISRSPEHGTTVVYADCFTPDEERRRAERDGDEPNAIPFLKRFTVFDADQLLAAVRP